MSTLNEAIERACEEPTLEDAVALICVWECERVIRTVIPDQPYETCFKYVIREVTEAYNKT